MVCIILRGRPSNSGVFIDSKNYVINGPLTVGYIPSFVVRVYPGNSINLTSIIMYIGTGTSATITAYQNGVAIPWASNLVITSSALVITATSTTPVNDLDQFSAEIISTNGTPANLTMAFCNTVTV